MKGIESSDYNGNIVAVKVRQVIIKEQNPFYCYYMIIGENWRLAATGYHIFLTIRDGENMRLAPYEMQKDDIIWIDKIAFLSDGSLYIEK